MKWFTVHHCGRPEKVCLFILPWLALRRTGLVLKRTVVILSWVALKRSWTRRFHRVYEVTSPEKNDTFSTIRILRLKNGVYIRHSYKAYKTYLVQLFLLWGSYVFQTFYIYEKMQFCPLMESYIDKLIQTHSHEQHENVTENVMLICFEYYHRDKFNEDAVVLAIWNSMAELCIF